MTKEAGVIASDIELANTINETGAAVEPQVLADYRDYGYDLGYRDGLDALVDEIFADIIHALAVCKDIDAVHFRRVAIVLYGLREGKSA